MCLLVPGCRGARRHRRAASPPTTPGCDRQRSSALGADFDKVVADRRAEADDFYAELTPSTASPDEAMVMRQAFAGMLWSKQLYYYDVARWLDGDPTQPPPPASRLSGRNARWRNFDAFDIMSMPDKWEYPWFAAWDLAFHCVALAHVDPAFAKYQLILLCREWFQHPNGALPAYEWDFGDVNPPVQAWAALEVFAIDGGHDIDFLSRVFDKLLVNFTWWVNLEDKTGCNLFEGGFLGLDNIGPIDRSHLPVGGILEQSDATGWMAAYALAMTAMAAMLNRSGQRPGSDLVVKFVEHFAAISEAIDTQGLWDDVDGLFYDRLVTPDGTQVPVKVRSMVGIIPTLAAAVVDEPMLERSLIVAKVFPRLLRRQGLEDEDKLAGAGLLKGEPGGRRLLLGVVGVDRLERIFAKLFDENEFLSPYGLRAISAYHRDHPYELELRGFGPPSTTSRPSRPPPCLAGTPTGGARCGFRSTTWSRVPGALPPLLRRRVPDRVPHRVGPETHARRDRPGPAPTPDLHLPGRRRRPEAMLRGGRSAADTTRPGRTTWCSTSTSTATTAPGWAPPIRPAGPVWSPTPSAAATARWHPSATCSASVGRRPSHDENRPSRPMRCCRAARSRSGRRPMAGGTNFAVASGSPREWCCASSTTPGPRPRSPCRTSTPGCGTVSCPGSGPGRPTVIAPPVPTIRPGGCAATRPNY